MAYNPFHKNAYLGNGQYDQLEVLRKSKDPLINYEGLYEDPHRFLETADRYDQTGQSDNWWSGDIPVNRRARADNRAINRDRPLPLAYGMRSSYFDDFNPRVGQSLGYQEAEADQDIDLESLRDPFVPEVVEESETIEENNIPQNYPIPQNFRTRMNNPFFERPTLSNAPNLANYLNQGLGGVKGIKEKMGQGWDFAKQLPGMAMSALSGIPGAGLLMGMLPKSSPEQKAMMELYNSEDYQNLLNQIPGMANYNPVYGMGSGYGLTNAINKRLATLAKTRKRQGDDFSATLRKREEDLKNLLAQEASKDFARTGASGRRPGTTGGAYSGEHRDSQSRGQASAGNTGGYSYDRGGRQGYGYGLRDGGLATLFTRRG